MTSFEADIRPLFRETDRIDMDFMFDLWDYDDVRADAANILARVVDGTMPCDGAWPQDRIELLRSWIDEGCPR
jgi:hypothetical protein